MNGGNSSLVRVHLLSIQAKRAVSEATIRVVGSNPTPRNNLTLGGKERSHVKHILRCFHSSQSRSVT
jgi:hypothetical protein